METNGLVLRAAFALQLAVASVCAASDELVLLNGVDDSAVPASYGAADEDYITSCGCSPCRDSFLFAGAEMTFLDVEAKSGGRVTLSFDDSGTVGATDYSAIDGDGLEDFAYAPRVWAGAKVTDHIGIVGRYWHLSDADGHLPNTIVPTLTNFATIYEADRVEAYTADLEGLITCRYGCWTIDTTAGARHASLSVDSLIHAFGVFTTGNFVNLLLSNGSNFDGTGLTYGMVGRRQIGNTPLNVFISGRGTYIDGDSHSDSFGRSAGAVASSPSAPLVGAATVTRANADSRLTIVEFQVGGEVEYQLHCIPATAFFRTAYEYQNWEIIGPPTGGAGFGGTIGTLTTNSFASAGLGNMILNGVVVSTGFSW